MLKGGRVGERRRKEEEEEPRRSTSRVDTEGGVPLLSHMVLASPEAASPWREAIFSTNITGQNCATCLS